MFKTQVLLRLLRYATPVPYGDSSKGIGSWRLGHCKAIDRQRVCLRRAAQVFMRSNLLCSSKVDPMVPGMDLLSSPFQRRYKSPLKQGPIPWIATLARCSRRPALRQPRLHACIILVAFVSTINGLWVNRVLGRTVNGFLGVPFEGR